MFTRLDYSSALEYSIIRRYTNILYYYYYHGNIVDSIFSLKYNITLNVKKGQLLCFISSINERSATGILNMRKG